MHILRASARPPAATPPWRAERPPASTRPPAPPAAIAGRSARRAPCGATSTSLPWTTAAAGSARLACRAARTTPSGWWDNERPALRRRAHPRLGPGGRARSRGQRLPLPTPLGLNTLGSTGLSWNLELRGFYYGVDGTPYAFPGLGGWLRFEPSERWSFDVEAVLRDKVYLDYEREDLSPIQLKTALVRYHDPAGRFDLSLGRQEVQLADGLIMDEFLDAAQIEWRSGSFEVRAGAGILALSAAKESLYCAKCLFFEYRSCWKGFGESAYGDFKTAFVQASASLGAAGTVGLVYQKVSAADPAFDSDMAGVFAGLALPFRWRLGFEAALQKQPLHEAPAFGFHVDLYRSWRIAGWGSLQLRLQDLYGSAEGSLVFSPTFGNLHLGDRQHYSVRQGHTIGLGLKLTPEFYKPITLRPGILPTRRRG